MVVGGLSGKVLRGLGIIDWEENNSKVITRLIWGHLNMMALFAFFSCFENAYNS